MAPIEWYSKKQGSIEAATFGSELMAMKTAAESNRGLRYKLRMMGVPIDGPMTLLWFESLVHPRHRSTFVLHYKLLWANF